MPDTMISTVAAQRGGTTPSASGQPGGAESGSADFAGLLAAAGQAAPGKAPAAGRHKGAAQAVPDQQTVADTSAAAQAPTVPPVVAPVPPPLQGGQATALSGAALPTSPSATAGIDRAGMAADAALAGTLNGAAPAGAAASGAGAAVAPATLDKIAGGPPAPVSDSATQPQGAALPAAPPGAPPAATVTAAATGTAEALPAPPEDGAAVLPAAVAAVAGAVPVPRPSAAGTERAPGIGGTAAAASRSGEETGEEGAQAAATHGPARPVGRVAGAAQHGRPAGEEGKAALPQQSQAAAAAAAASGSAEPPTPATPESARPSFTVEALPPPAAQAATHYATSAAAGTAPAVGRALPSAAEQVAAPLLRVAAAGGGEFQIELTPAGLGHVRVVAEVSDGQVSLRVQTERADTLDIIRADLRHLERSLGDAGFKLDGAAVQFSLRGDEGSQGRAGGFAGGGGAGGGRSNPWQAEHEPQQQAERLLPPLDGLVDVTV